jgi:DNA polymerase I
MWDFYQTYTAPFGELLTDMEREGFRVRVEEYLPSMAKQAEKDIETAADHFREWAAAQIPEARHMNIQSGSQLQAFFFSHQPKHDFKYENTTNYIEPGSARPKRYRTFKIPGLGMKPASRTATGLPTVSASALRLLCGTHFLPLRLSCLGFYRFHGNMIGTPHDDPPKYGTAFDFFGGGEAGREACVAIDSLLQVRFVCVCVRKTHETKTS